MRRRQFIFSAAGLTVAGGVAASAGFTLRLHATPRQWPKLEAEHLSKLMALPLTPQRVLFVGNSYTLDHDLPQQVEALAGREDVSLQVGVAAARGARLIETWHIPEFRAVLDFGWDVLVFQDLSTTVLRAPDRWGSALTEQSAPYPLDPPMSVARPQTRRVTEQ